MNKCYIHTYLFLCLFLCCANVALAQDIHFSQFYAAPLNNNPANTGNFDGDWRVGLNYRQQWAKVGEPYSTTALAYDRQVKLLGQQLSVGAYFINDQSGNADLLANKFVASLGYHRNSLGGNFHLGLQVGYITKSFNRNKLTFPEQFDNSIGYFNHKLPNSESKLMDKLNYIDMNVGVAWNKSFGKLEPHVGFSVFHVNRPSETFFNSKNSLPFRPAVDGGFKYLLLNDRVYIYPNMLLMFQQKAQDLLLGINTGYYLKNNKYNIKAAFAGLAFRNTVTFNTDAAVFIVGLNMERWDFGMSYDINVSDLSKATNFQGGFEISIIYSSISTIFANKLMPCFRY